MIADENALVQFTTRIRQMILRYEEISQEKKQLRIAVEEKEAQIAELTRQIEHLQHEYNSLKMAKMIEITDDDMETSKKKISKLIRDINKCITLLSEK